MPAIALTQPHSVSADEARRRIAAMFERLQKDHAGQLTDVRQEWKGDKADFSFRAAGMSLSGQVVIAPQEVRIRLDVPMMAMFFAGMIEAKMKDALAQAFA